MVLLDRYDSVPVSSPAGLCDASGQAVALITVRHFAGPGYASSRSNSLTQQDSLPSRSLGLEDIHETTSAVEGAAPDNPILVPLCRDKPTRQN